MDDGKFFVCFAYSLRVFARNLFRFAQRERFTQISQRGRKVRQGDFFGLKEEEGNALGLPKCSMFNGV